MKIVKWITTIVTIVIAAVSVWILLSLPAHKAPLKKSAETLRIGLANLSFENKRIRALSEIVKEIEPDLLIGLEWTGNNLDLAALKHYGYKTILDAPQKGTHGICIIGKGNLKARATAVQSPVRGPCRMPIGIARFQLKDNPLSVLGVHAPPPIRACRNTTEPTLKVIASWVADGRLQQHIGIAQKGDLVIIMGDMNTLPFQPAINYFKNAGMRDSYSNTNWRPGPTWSPVSWFPAFCRIDYIFVPTQVGILNSQTFNLPGSDHRGIFVDIEGKH